MLVQPASPASFPIQRILHHILRAALEPLYSYNNSPPARKKQQLKNYVQFQESSQYSHKNNDVHQPVRFKQDVKLLIKGRLLPRIAT